MFSRLMKPTSPFIIRAPSAAVAGGGRAKKCGLSVILIVDEETPHAVREEAPQPEEKPAIVDDVAPCLADAPRRREAARRETAEEVRQQVVG